MAGLAAYSAFREEQTPTAAADASSPREDGSSAVRPFCASRSPKPAFCADFDNGSTMAGFRGFDTFDGGTIVLDDAYAVSAPASVRMNVPPTSPRCAYTRLIADVKRAFEHARFSFAVRLGRGSVMEFPAGIVGAFEVEASDGKRDIPEDLGPFEIRYDNALIGLR